MPITGWQMHGNWAADAPRKYGFTSQDASILGQYAEKIHKKWSNSRNNFDFYFVRSPKAYRQVEIGEVTPEWVFKNIGIEVQPNPNSISVIFTNNTGTEKIPMTAWALAHRLGHAIRRTPDWEHFRKEVFHDFAVILRDVYQAHNTWSPYGEDEKLFRDLFHAVGTMKSTRDRNLVSAYEFLYEMLAQYILTGKIRFSPLPRAIGTRRAFGRGGYKYSRG
jgi:hypothetical protein